MQKTKLGLIKTSTQYRNLMNSIEDDGIATLVQDESGVLISLAFALGLIQGTKTMSRHLMEQIHELMKENTSSAKSVVLKNRSPILYQKKKITIDVARSYMNDHPNEKLLTVNALMVQIRGNVEKNANLTTYQPQAQLLYRHI
jgi:hypothetical protein